jgi:glycosyltransferase involved in cell wall biosynthesis
LRALFLGPVPPRPGGGSISRGQIIAGLAEAGWEIAVVAPITAEAFHRDGDSYAAQHPRLRVYRYLVPNFHLESEKRAPLDLCAAEAEQVPRLLHQLISSFEPEILIAGIETCGDAIRALAQEYNLPWSVWLRGNPTSQILAGSHPEERVGPFIEMLKAADLVVAVAQYMADDLSLQFGLDEIAVVPNAIDLEAFAARIPSPELVRTLNIEQSTPMVLAPANFTGRKRPFDFVRAAARVLKSRRDTLFVMVGTGPMQREVMALVDDLGINQNFRFPGLVPYAMMPDLFALSDIVVMTSEAEGLARVYVETMAAARPLVASDIAAAKEIIEDGNNGLLFSLGKDDELAERLISLLDDPERRLVLGSAAQQSVGDRGICAAVDAYIKIYSRLEPQN